MTNPALSSSSGLDESNSKKLSFQEKFFLGSVCILSAIPTMKIGLIEPLELFFLLHLTALFILFVSGGFQIKLSRVWIFYGIPHALFMIAAFVLAIVSLRQTFFPVVSETGVLKQPFNISMARLIEYFLVAFYMLYIADRLRQKRAALVFAMKAYIFAALVSAAYGLVSFPLSFLVSFDYLGAGEFDHRVKGLFNEGGPFGLYLVSVLLCVFLLYSMKEIRLKTGIWLTSVFTVTLALTQSKAGYSAVAIMILATVLFGRSLRIKLVLLACLGVMVVGVLSTPNLYLTLMQYVTAATDKTTGLLDDSSFGFGGREAAAILVPRMISAHPFVGLGIGNYQLVRNDPAYLQGIPPLEHWDYSGAGLFVKIAELGIPLSLFLVGVLLLPLRTAVKKNANMLIKLSASYQLIAALQGVELHFFYPWLCSAFVLAILFFMPTPAITPYSPRSA